MKKRILALVIACLTILSFSVSAAAATISVGTVKASDFSDGKILVPIKISNFHTSTSDTILGLSGFQLKINFDKSKLQVVQNGLVQGDVPTTSGSPATWSGLATVVAKNNANRNGNFTVMYADQTGGGAAYAEDLRGDKEVLFYVTFTAVDGAVDSADISVEVTSATMMTYVEAVEQVNVAAEYGVAAGKVILTETVTPSIPETSTVRTFPKLRWDETNKQLTTVGVITIGKDYDTVKYGINIEKGEGTVNYWANSAVKTTDEKEAYYAVRLDDIDDETTDIKSTSAAKAILSNGAEGDSETKDSVIE